MFTNLKRTLTTGTLLAALAAGTFSGTAYAETPPGRG